MVMQLRPQQAVDLTQSDRDAQIRCRRRRLAAKPIVAFFCYQGVNWILLLRFLLCVTSVTATRFGLNVWATVANSDNEQEMPIEFTCRYSGDIHHAIEMLVPLSKSLVCGPYFL